jgi:hypothetical protein
MAKRKSLVAMSPRTVTYGIYVADGKEIDLFSMTSS